MPRRIDHYDSVRWGQGPARTELHPREHTALAFLAPEVHHAHRFLDVGCGDGAFLAALESHHPHLALSGIDMSESQVLRARLAAPSADVQLAIADERLPFDDAAFDFVYAGEVIEHAYDPDHFIQECVRVLAPYGTLVISTPNLAAWYNRILLLAGLQPVFYETSTVSNMVGAGLTRRLRKSTTPVGHLRLFTTTAIKDLMELYGLKVIGRRGAPFHALSGWLALIDRALVPIPSLASIHLAKARHADSAEQ